MLKCKGNTKLCKKKCIPQWQECIEPAEKPAPLEEPDTSSYDRLLDDFRFSLDLRRDVLKRAFNTPLESSKIAMQKIEEGNTFIRRQISHNEVNFRPTLNEYAISRINRAIVESSNSAWQAVEKAANMLTHSLVALLWQETTHEKVYYQQVVASLNRPAGGVGNTLSEIWNNDLDLSTLKETYVRYVKIGRENMLRDQESESGSPTRNAIHFFEDFKGAVTFSLSEALIGTGVEWKEPFSKTFHLFATIYGEPTNSNVTN
jgi:hypothetical protein